MKPEYIYKCTNDSCGEINEPDYEISFREEMVDDQNIAAMFCPKCNSKLQKKNTSKQAA